MQERREKCQTDSTKPDPHTTCVICLFFIPLYFIGKHPDLRVTVLCVSLSLNCAVALGCLFGPKVYICLLWPQNFDNNRERNSYETIEIIDEVNGEMSADFNNHLGLPSIIDSVLKIKEGSGMYG